MGKIIFLGILAVLVLGPTIVWRVYRRNRYSLRVKELVSKPFVCPNCGHRFYADSKIIYPLGPMNLLADKLFLKCPQCGKRDLCGRPYDFEDK